MICESPASNSKKDGWENITLTKEEAPLAKCWSNLLISLLYLILNRISIVLDIAYAGTASSTRFRGFTKNTYNIIEIDDDGKVNIDMKIVDGRRLPLIDIVKKA